MAERAFEEFRKMGQSVGKKRTSRVKSGRRREGQERPDPTPAQPAGVALPACLADEAVSWCLSSKDRRRWHVPDCSQGLR